MADPVSLTSREEQRPLHPFFQHNRSVTPTLAKPDAVEDTTDSADRSICSCDGTCDEKSHEEDAPHHQAVRCRKRRKSDSGMQEDSKKLPSKKRNKVPSAGSIANLFVRLHRGNGKDGKASVEQSVDEGRPTTVKDTQQAHPSTEVAKEHGDNKLSDEKENEQAVLQVPSTLSQLSPGGLTEEKSKPKKMLLFNPKTGTIGSPPKQNPRQPEAEGTEPHTPKKRSRQKPKPSKLVRIRYGTNDESRARIGGKVNDILSRPPARPSNVPVLSSPKSKVIPDLKMAVDQNASKSTHPFFLGPVNPPKGTSATAMEYKPKTSIDSPLTKRFSSTPCSPRKAHVAGNSFRMPQFGTKKTGLKVPGSKLAAWPWKDMAHVRGADSAIMHMLGERELHISSRKSKGHAVILSAKDSIVAHVTEMMDIPILAAAIQNVNTAEFSPSPPELRLPQKHFESGQKLQKRVLRELRCFKRHTSVQGNVNIPTEVSDGVIVATQSTSAVHPPQICRLYDSIRYELSAFDRSQCETTSWTQKYAPRCADEIIQPGREAFFLKEWLQALMVQSVETGSSEDGRRPGNPAKPTGLKPAKKRKKKQLDGFIVSSDEEADEMDEIETRSETEGEWGARGSHGPVKRTVIRAGDFAAKGLREKGRLQNTVLISGPHGCGKTAMVYAVAKELGFEVFEINSSRRRSGKDVLDQIGDMTRNHLVSHQHPNTSDPNEVVADIGDETAIEVQSGKQPTMSSFFKPTAVDKSRITQKAKKASKQPTKPISQKKSRSEASKGQKQSLILLDEVDILFDDDKQFWSTIVGLANQSKRPFIMTCNDESLVPLQSFSLHGIFRLSAPPTDLAVDRLILIAANEGHALCREAVEALYESRRYDLRASTMDLNYWCQLGVGDRRGGFNWFYPRWPKGVDLDENKDVVRVVSENTYQKGMNWLGRDALAAQNRSAVEIEQELLQQAWDSWGLDLGQLGSSTLPISQGDEAGTVASRGLRLEALKAFDQFSEIISAADICSSKSFASSTEGPIDATSPELSLKMRNDYILGLQLLDAPPVSRYDSTATDLPLTMKSLARALLDNAAVISSSPPKPELTPIKEDQVLSAIHHHVTTLPLGISIVSRADFSLAFDPIAAYETSQLSSLLHLDPSVFDRQMNVVAIDVAPYVRSIVAFDAYLQKQRLKLSNLLSSGGRPGAKRMRTTRAAYSALEGGSRSTTRGDRWFKADLNPHLVAKTGGKGWTDLAIHKTDTTNNADESQKPMRSEARKGRCSAILDESDDEIQ